MHYEIYALAHMSHIVTMCDIIVWLAHVSKRTNEIRVYCSLRSMKKIVTQPRVSGFQSFSARNLVFAGFYLNPSLTFSAISCFTAATMVLFPPSNAREYLTPCPSTGTSWPGCLWLLVFFGCDCLWQGGCLSRGFRLCAGIVDRMRWDGLYIVRIH